MLISLRVSKEDIPCRVANIKYNICDITSYDFLDQITGIINDDNAYTYIYVSIADNYKNMDISLKIAEYIDFMTPTYGSKST